MKRTSVKSKTVTLVNTGSLLINARCNAQGEPVVYAFDNSTTLAKRNVCTVYGTAISS
jgi:hypothetical protein